MKIGDLVKWSWHLDTDWAQTHFMGVVVGSKTYKMGKGLNRCVVFNVLVRNGQTIQVREDEATLELINVS